MNPLLQTSIEYLKGAGPQRGELLRKEFEVYTFGDLLRYYPFRYVDRSVIHKISDISPLTQYIQLKGEITAFTQAGDKRHKRLMALFRDGTGEIELIWFQSIDWILKSLKPKVPYLVFGRPSIFNGEYNIAHPEIELFTDELKTSGKGL